jgi:pimeloyl-ACP methyl ester carboxylesterase
MRLSDQHSNEKNNLEDRSRLLNRRNAIFGVLAGIGGGTLLAACSDSPAQAQAQSSTSEIPGFSVSKVNVNGVELYFESGGTGEPVLLIHGYTQTGRSWRPLAIELARTRRVIVPDLRGIGKSEITQAGYDKKNAAADMRSLIKLLGFSTIDIVAHDIGLMIGYAYAAQWPTEVRKLLVMDAPLPGIGPNWESVWRTPALWHFHFNGPTPEALVKDRERLYFDHFWDDFSATKGAVKEADRLAYMAAYTGTGRMRAGWEYFKAFAQDSIDNAVFANTKLAMPVLTMAGEFGGGALLGSQWALVANKLESQVLPSTGHWLLEEKESQVIESVQRFLRG